MTEAEWLVDPRKPLIELHRFASLRKIRLAGAAFELRVQDQVETSEHKPCAALLEEAAESPRPWEQLETELWKRSGSWRFTHLLYPHPVEEIAHRFRRLVSLFPEGTWDLACLIVREIIGNPFRPVAFNPEWRTSNVVSLAKSMYDSREFGSMPILGDALQDAGCEHEDILAHCRGDGPHVRGCWVIDLILGKE